MRKLIPLYTIDKIKLYTKQETFSKWLGDVDCYTPSDLNTD